MKGRQSRESPAKADTQQQSATALKKPRGRPRKSYLDNDKGSNATGREIRPILEKVLAKKKITNFKDALEQLQEIHDYVIDSIEFGEFAGYRKCTLDEL